MLRRAFVCPSGDSIGTGGTENALSRRQSAVGVNNAQSPPHKKITSGFGFFGEKSHNLLDNVRPNAVKC